MTDDITWDDAISSGGFVRLEFNEGKKLKITNWGFREVEKFGKKAIEFVSDCTEENGKEVEKKFTTMSNRLKQKLKPILEKKEITDTVHVDVLKAGDPEKPMDAKFIVKEIK